jgi:sugar phosphate isomerase/epimerase
VQGGRLAAAGGQSSALAHTSADRDAIARDLRKLAMLALPFGIKVAYVALSWGRVVRDFPTALDIVGRAEMPNLGIGIDSFHVLAAQSSLDELEMVLPETILLVQLSDFMVTDLPSLRDRVSTANHLRVFRARGCTARSSPCWCRASRPWATAATTASRSSTTITGSWTRRPWPPTRGARRCGSGKMS